jgi:transposase
MPTAELELVEDVEYEPEDEYEYTEEAEVEVIEPMTKTKAKALDKKVRTATEKITTQRDALFDLLEEAAAGQIHVALGYASWPAWLADAVNYTPVDMTERQELVKAFSAKGASQRAIAGMFNVSQKTIDRDLEGEEFEDDTVTSLTGVTVPRNKKKTTTTTVVVEEEEDEEEQVKPTTAADLVAEFDVEAANAHNAVAAMLEIMTEPKWPGARKRVGKAHLNHLGEWMESLQTIGDDLMSV